MMEIKQINCGGQILVDNNLYDWVFMEKKTTDICPNGNCSFSINFFSNKIFIKYFCEYQLLKG